MHPQLSAKDIYLAAIDLPDAAARARYLDEACAGDVALRAMVDALLAAEPAEGFLAQPAVAGVEELADSVPGPGTSLGYFGDYVLLSEIARGATGVVFRARQTSLNRVVALKMLRERVHVSSPADEKRFRVEAEAVASLDHPNIVPIHEIGSHQGQGYFTMKLIGGGTLQWRGGEFRDPRRAAALMAKVARAVHHAHQHGILHRDLKPGNILLDRDDEPQVVDFGIARRLDEGHGLTHTGQIMGTPHYMAPEQARGENRQLTPAADVYSLGAVLHELLTGRKPFESESMLELLQQVTSRPPAPLRLGDPDMEAVVLRCLEKAPGSRYGSASELADELERWLRGEPVRARRNPWPMRVVKWGRRQPAHAALALIGTGCMAGLVGLAFAPRGQHGNAAAPGVPAAPMPPVAVPAAVPSPPAAPAAVVVPLSAEEAAANRRAAEWMARVNGRHGCIILRRVTGEIVSVTPGVAVPPGDFIVLEFTLDLYEGGGSEPVRESDFIAAMSGLTRLEKVYFRALPLRSPAFAFLAANPSLQQVVFEDLPVGDSLLTHLAGLQSVHSIGITHTSRHPEGFTGRGLAELACLPELRRLSLYGTSVDSEHLGFLARCPNLAGLGLGKVPGEAGTITDATLEALRHCSRLEGLGLDSSHVTDAGLVHLHGLTRLKELSLERTRVTAAGVGAVRQALPGLIVAWGGD